MANMQYLGRHELIARLTSQVGDREKAIAILRKRGHVDALGKLTAAGKVRDAMTARERALDRASTSSGKPKSAFTYNPRTNSTKRK